MTITEGLIYGAITVLVLAVMFLAAVADLQKKKEWEAFKLANDCKVTSRIDGDVLPTVAIGADGKAAYGITATPTKTGWTCNDGVTYFK